MLLQLMNLPALARRRPCSILVFMGLGFAALHAAEPWVISDLGIKLMPIPAGTFTMGSPPTEAGRTQSEGPQTRVTISHPFWLGQTAVTQSQWRAIMGTGVEEEAQKMLADNTLYDFGGKLGRITTREFIRWRDHDAPLVCNVGDDVPMYWINWYQAVEFCHRLTKRERAA